MGVRQDEVALVLLFEELFFLFFFSFFLSFFLKICFFDFFFLLSFFLRNCNRAECSHSIRLASLKLLRRDLQKRKQVGAPLILLPPFPGNVEAEAVDLVSDAESADGISHEKKQNEKNKNK